MMQVLGTARSSVGPEVYPSQQHQQRLTIFSRFISPRSGGEDWIDSRRALNHYDTSLEVPPQDFSRAFELSSMCGRVKQESHEWTVLSEVGRTSLHEKIRKPRYGVFLRYTCSDQSCDPG